MYVHVYAVHDGTLINLVNTPIMDGQSMKLLTVEVLMVSSCYLSAKCVVISTCLCSINGNK